jgi:carbon-monoxide dehydrogenase medium subunit
MYSEFEYLTPTSWEEAAASLEDGTSAVLAGGTDLLTRVNARLRTPPARLVSLRALPAAPAVSHAGAELVVEARALLDQVLSDEAVRMKFAALAEACAHIGSPQTRNRATLVGNLCSASSAADACPASLCFSPLVRVQTEGGLREMPLSELFAGPRQTSLGAKELVREVVFRQPPPRTGSAYRRVGSREVCDCATVVVAVALSLDEAGGIAQAAIGLGSVAPMPLRATEAEELLRGKTLDADLAAYAAELAARATTPITDIRGSADYRRQVVQSVLPAVLRTAHCRAQRTCS